MQRGFPRLYAAASLKLVEPLYGTLICAQFSAALCRGLIEARRPRASSDWSASRFPRLYAAASLKHHSGPPLAIPGAGFPRLYAAASLKQRKTSTSIPSSYAVFRGSMPRPH